MPRGTGTWSDKDTAHRRSDTPRTFGSTKASVLWDDQIERLTMQARAVDAAHPTGYSTATLAIMGIVAEPSHHPSRPADFGITGSATTGKSYSPVQSTDTPEPFVNIELFQHARMHQSF